MMTHGIMSTLLAYNQRVGSVELAQRAINDLENLASQAKTPEMRKRYADAAVETKNEILPKMEKEMRQLAQQLGLSGSKIGDSITKEELEELLGPDIGLNKKDGKLSFFKGYFPGNYLSKNT